MTNPRHFLDLKDHSSNTLRTIIDDARTIKDERTKSGRMSYQPLAGKMLAMIFDKPSTLSLIHI